MRLILPILLLLSSYASAFAAKRVLYVTATAGFRHTDSIDASIGVMQQIARDSGVLEIVHTEDLSLISAENLRNFDAIYFFTSGELPLSDQQKSDLLDFVRQGKGFGGSHSATDCLYTWPDYGDMIGAYFDGHPWAQEAGVNVEDPENPIVAHLAPSFRTTEEFYQFRNFSRDRVRVLLTLDTRTVDMTAAGINRTDDDFALVWIRKYGNGRVFYSAFGHFPESFTSPPLRTMLMKGLLWITGEVDADATPRSGPSAPVPAVSANGVHSLGGGSDAFAPGALVSIAGERLTSGSSLSAAAVPLPVRLAGTHVEVNGIPAPLFMAAPGQVLAQLPGSLAPGQTATLTVSSVNRASEPVPLRIEAAAPGIVAATRVGNIAVLFVVGLGATQPAVSEGTAAPASPLARTIAQPAVRIGGQTALVAFSGLAPGLVGVYQVNATIPPDAAIGSDGQWEIVIEAGGRASNAFRLSAR
jgi:uncharacterized protein (TIGR03437 family)